MNERESSGLPLRAMVMVLLFLGVVFLLVGFQAMGRATTATAADDSAVGRRSPPPPTAAPTSDAAEPAKAEVRVFNISEVAGAAETHRQPAARGRLERHRDRKPHLEGLTATTVYFSEAPGEQESADEVGQLLRGAGRTAGTRTGRATTGIMVSDP